MRRYLKRQGFALVVGRTQPFIGAYRASVFDRSGEYCGGINAPDLRTLVDGLAELLQPDSPLLYAASDGGAMARRWGLLRIAYRQRGGTFALQWSPDGTRVPLAVVGSLGSVAFTYGAASVDALADLLSDNLNRSTL